MKEKVFITGGAGFLGSNVVRLLLETGYEVTILVEKGKEISSSLDGLDVTLVEGDILDAQSMNTAIKGMDYVIHTAALAAIWKPKGEIYYRVNVDGAINIANAVMENGVKRMVHIGTANSFAFGTMENPGYEGPENKRTYGLDYIKSKLAAQKWLINAYREKGLPVIMVNPTFMIGPYDSKPSSGQFILAIAQQKVPGYTAGGRNYVHVRDVSTAIVNALKMGRLGACYIGGHENLPYKVVMKQVADLLEVPAPSRPLPTFFVKAFGWINSMLGYLGLINPGVTLEVAKISCDQQYFTAAKAVEELNMPQTPIEEAFKEAIQWFRENGYLDQN